LAGPQIFRIIHFFLRYFHLFLSRNKFGLIAKFTGYPYKMIGDAFQVAFDTAPAAVAAAVDVFATGS
jgi:hypothetical protein